LLFSAEINQENSTKLTTALAEAMDDPQIEAIYLGFSTTGGSVVNGVALHHIIKGSKKPITIHALGNVDSIGLTIFLAGHSRYAVPHTRFLFHSLAIGSDGSRMDARWISERLNALQADETRIAGIWKSSNGKFGDEEIASLFEGEQIKNTAWAIERGFISEVRDFWFVGGARVKNVA